MTGSTLGMLALNEMDFIASDMLLTRNEESPDGAELQYLFVTHTAVKHREGVMEGSDRPWCYFWPQNTFLNWKTSVGFLSE